MPDAEALDILTGSNGGSGANDGDQFSLPHDLDTQNTEAGLFTVEGDPFNGSEKRSTGKSGVWGVFFERMAILWWFGA